MNNDSDDSLEAPNIIIQTSDKKKIFNQSLLAIISASILLLLLFVIINHFKNDDEATEPMIPWNDSDRLPERYWDAMAYTDVDDSKDLGTLLYEQAKPGFYE